MPGAYRFCSLTSKGLERRLDGSFELDGHAGPVDVVEFQGQHLDEAWYNLLTKIGLYGEAHPRRLDAWLDGMFDAASVEALIGDVVG